MGTGDRCGQDTSKCWRVILPEDATMPEWLRRSPDGHLARKGERIFAPNKKHPRGAELDNELYARARMPNAIETLLKSVGVPWSTFSISAISESYDLIGYFVADAVYVAVPLVASKAHEWVPPAGWEEIALWAYDAAREVLAAPTKAAD
jgi:hypothetical protein